MESKLAASCPVSGVKVNENVVRIIALLVVILASICSYFQFVALSLLLSFDFALRAFGSGKLSLLRNVSFQISRYLKLKNKPVDAAPKKFAASLGFVFSLSSGILHLFGLHDAATIVLVMLIFCALAESILSFCLGCLMYNWLQKYHLLNSN